MNPAVSIFREKLFSYLPFRRFLILSKPGKKNIAAPFLLNET